LSLLQQDSASQRVFYAGRKPQVLISGATIKRQGRENTPTADAEDLTILIMTPDGPMHPLGFRFGNDTTEDAVDVVIGDHKLGVSRHHFTLTYEWEARTLRIISNSRASTRDVTEAGEKQLAHGEAHVLRHHELIFAGHVAMFVQYPDRGRHEQRFRANWQKLGEKLATQPTRIDHVSLEDPGQLTISPSR
jgi:hypothetical protein